MAWRSWEMLRELSERLQQEDNPDQVRTSELIQYKLTPEDRTPTNAMLLGLGPTTEHAIPECDICDDESYNLPCQRCGLRVCTPCYYDGFRCNCTTDRRGPRWVPPPIPRRPDQEDPRPSPGPLDLIVPTSLILIHAEAERDQIYLKGPIIHIDPFWQCWQ